MAGWDYTDSGTGGEQFELESISVSPDPPEPGKDLTITIQGKLAQPLQKGAYVELQVKLGLIRLVRKTLDLCAELEKMGVAIPVPAGDFKLVHKVTLPREIPRAKFTIATDAYTVDDEDLFAVAFKVDFATNPF